MVYLVPSVVDFGAIGDGIADDTGAIQAAVNSGVAFVPEGVFRTTSRIFIPSRSGLVGVYSKSTIWGDNVPGAILETVPGSTEIVVEKISIRGSGQTGVYVNSSTLMHMTAIQLVAEVDDGFIFENTWGSYFNNLATNGKPILNTCFKVGENFNANMCSHWYTSNLDTAVNILINGGHGSTFCMMTCQGGQVGLSIVGGSGHTFNGFYSENVVLPIQIGEAGSPLVTTIAIKGGSIGGPYINHPGYSARGAHIQIASARSISIDTVSLNGYFIRQGETLPTLDGVYYTDCSNVDLKTIYIPVLTARSHYKAIKRSMAGPNTGAEIRITTVADENRTQFMMKGPTNSAKFFLMELDLNGNWVANNHIPDFAVAPPVSNNPLTQHQDNTPYELDHFVYTEVAALGASVYRCVVAGVTGGMQAPSQGSGVSVDGSVHWAFHGILV